jgi:hypothetical protein
VEVVVIFESVRQRIGIPFPPWTVPIATAKNFDPHWEPSLHHRALYYSGETSGEAQSVTAIYKVSRGQDTFLSREMIGVFRRIFKFVGELSFVCD